MIHQLGDAEVLFDGADGERRFVEVLHPFASRARALTVAPGGSVIGPVYMNAVGETSPVVL